MSNAYDLEEGVRESVAQLGHHHACIVFRSLLIIASLHSSLLL
jgi:hypothetical protein